ncbi:hypothetical protein ACFPJ1_28975 [Kribbella qitaiheensis]|uniref:hypothetical protein n=1 Tax=Kribbella qitaiheensis TaxID=1544730 RepID=UPI00360942C6
MIRHTLTGGALAAVLTITPAVSATADTTPAPAPQSYLAQRAAVPAAKVAAAQAAADFDTMAGTRPLLRVPFRCNENWSGASRTGHSPSYWSLDPATYSRIRDC